MIRSLRNLIMSLKSVDDIYSLFSLHNQRDCFHIQEFDFPDEDLFGSLTSRDL